MKITTLLFVLILALAGCKEKSVTTADDGTLPGRFRVEIDPIRCAMPITQRLTIQSLGADKYQFTYDRFGVGSYQLTGIEAIKLSPVSYDLQLNGQSIGQYNFEELRSLNSTQKRWVLMVRHALNKPEGLEFMGVKE
ncbi:hypothetical protein GCM10028807_33940 [Spirosoma daeguense]